MDQNTNCLISVIIPVYNAEDTLLNCIESVLSQDYPEIELILVNDGSKDSSGKICDEAASSDKRIRVIHQYNQGVSAARNAGIDVASGNFLMFVDSDDQMLPGMIQNMYAHHDSEFGIILCGFQRITDNKNKTLFIFEQNVLESHIKKEEIASVYKKWLLNAPWNKLYNTELIKRKKIKFEPWCSMGEDLIFNLKYLSVMQGSICIINKPLYLYNFKRKNKQLLSEKPLFYDSIMKMYSYAMYYAKKTGVTHLDFFCETMFDSTLNSLEEYYANNIIDNHKEKLTQIKKRIHNRKFKKLLIHSRKNKKIKALFFYLLYTEHFQVYYICLLLRATYWIIRKKLISKFSRGN